MGKDQGAALHSDDFRDLSSPQGGRPFDVYNDVRDKLVAKGIPKEEVQFIHDADTETKKPNYLEKSEMALCAS